MRRYEPGMVIENVYGLCCVVYIHSLGAAMLAIIRPTDCKPGYYEDEPDCYPMPLEFDDDEHVRRLPEDLTDEEREALVRLMVKGATK